MSFVVYGCGCGSGSGSGLWWWLSWLVVMAGEFSGFLFCSSSLVLMGTVGLWLCSDFYGFDGGCGGVLVVE